MSILYFVIDKKKIYDWEFEAVYVFCRYPDTWYEEITSNQKFYSLAATYHSRIIGFIVSEIKQVANLNKEVWITVTL